MTALHSGIWQISGTTVMGPDNVPYTELPTIGQRMDTVPVRMGLRAMEWRYATMSGEEMLLFMGLWVAAANKPVQIKYLHPITFLPVTTEYWYMNEPVIGKRRMYLYDNVVIRFTPAYRTVPVAFSTTQPSVDALFARFINNEALLGSIASAEAFGAISVVQGATVIRPTAIPSAETFGTLFMIYDQFVSPSAIASSELFGTVYVADITFVSIAGIASEETIGDLEVILGDAPVCAEYLINPTLGPVQRQNKTGPYIRGGAIYTVLMEDSASIAMHVWKSDDAGATWAEQDASNRPDENNLSQPYDYTFSTDFRDDYIYVSYAHGPDGSTYVSRFDTTTDTWATFIAEDSAPGAPEAGAYRSSQMRMHTNGIASFYIDMFTSTSAMRRVGMEFYDTTTPAWTGSQFDHILGDDPGDYELQTMGSIVQESNDDTLIFWKQVATADLGTAPHDIYVTTANPSGFGTNTLVVAGEVYADRDAWNSSVVTFTAGPDTLYALLYKGETGDVKYIEVAEADYSTPTSSGVVATAPSGFTGLSAVAYDGTNPHAFYIAGDGIYHAERVSGTWTSPTQVIAHVGAQNISVTYDASTFHIVYVQSTNDAYYMGYIP